MHIPIFMCKCNCKAGDIMYDLTYLVECVNNVLDNRQLVATPENFGSAIRVNGKGKAYESGAWIRVERYNGNIIFNVNSVYLQPEFRGKGILDKICRAAIDSGEITGLQITSVISDEMHQWCRKRNFLYDEPNMRYIYTGDDIKFRQR